MLFFSYQFLLITSLSIFSIICSSVLLFSDHLNSCSINADDLNNGIDWIILTYSCDLLFFGHCCVCVCVCVSVSVWGTKILLVAYIFAMG